MHVLLLEDHRYTMRAYVGALLHAGHTSVSCETVTDALRHIDAERFDLLVSDGELPDGNGCQAMRRARLGHGLRGLIVTAHADNADVVRYQEAGFDEVLAKPVNFDKILRAMARVSALPQLLAPPGTTWPTFRAFTM